MKKFKSKPRTPAYVEEVYHRIEVEMCTARNAVVALDLRIGHIVAKLPPEDQAEVEAALKDYNVTVCTAISKAGGLIEHGHNEFNGKDQMLAALHTIDLLAAHDEEEARAVYHDFLESNLSGMSFEFKG